MTVRVTGHAVMRYQERVENVPEDRAVKALRSRAIELADAIGAPFVRLGGGAARSPAEPFGRYGASGRHQAGHARPEAR